MSFPRRSLLALCLCCSTGSVALGAACEPVKMAHEMPGPIGCGMRDPRGTGPSLLSVAQQTVLKNQGDPLEAEPNAFGGRTWVYVRQTGSVFGEQVTAEMFDFDAQGLLKGQRSELRKYAGK